ncbi:hypothetical protein Salat_2655700 [Sesamum alatum]|uniref:Uncharacterized protein n=1 Tax=Sesamum alatum TaxID=300844 RepID=A0AAE1XQ67_9LAMI|nr:hypothetical protein Salat_2655700 [Sesamum alatum]
MAAHAAMMANKGRQRQAELVEIALVVRVEVDLEPLDIPLTPLADVDHSTPVDPVVQVLEVVKLYSPIPTVAPLREYVASPEKVFESGAPLRKSCHCSRSIIRSQTSEHALDDPSDTHRSCEALKYEVQSLKAEIGALKVKESKAFESGMTRGKSLIHRGCMVKRATNESVVSFYKCLSQLKLLKALKDGFDPRQASFSKDAELQPYPKEEVVVDSVPDNEFAALVDSTPSLPSFGVVKSFVTPREGSSA